MIKKDSGSIKLPFFSRILNYGFQSFEQNVNFIDLIQGYKEQQKVDILANDPFYIEFFKNLFKVDVEVVLNHFYDYKNDTTFHEKFKNKLSELDKIDDGNTGDVRFNSLLLYTAVRIVKPQVVVETGVANGKSSALILLALSHNKSGTLYSFDLPNHKGNTLEDGSKTHTYEKEVGWLVPDYLKKNWELYLGDSLELMSSSKLPENIDIFFHDSLHTYKHTLAEIDIAISKASKDALILVDDIDMESGIALHDTLISRNKIGFAYREIGGFFI
jgi:predicted O-methyltransferase YrrM